MTVPKETLWEIDLHTRAKHEILRRYLNAWFPILSSWHQRIVYIDGFSGPGRYVGGEPGSPIIALDVAMNHRQTMDGELVFWFIDEREDRIAHLRQELQRLPVPAHFRITAESGKFHEMLGTVLDFIEADAAGLAPTFAFMDPFGFSGIPLALIERLLRHQRCEALITFMLEAINRFLEHPRDKIVQHIVEAFGTEEAIRIAEAPGDRIVNLRSLYQLQLQRVARFVRYFEIRDQQDRALYDLFFATNHELGHLRMKEAMWRVDPQGDFRFSDATNPAQLVLFQADSRSPLAKDLRDQFRGKGVVPVKLVRQYVENETAYLKKHMTASLRQEEAAGRISVEPQKSDGRKRKANTYPDDARISFL